MGGKGLSSGEGGRSSRRRRQAGLELGLCWLLACSFDGDGTQAGWRVRRASRCELVLEGGATAGKGALGRHHSVGSALAAATSTKGSDQGRGRAAQAGSKQGSWSRPACTRPSAGARGRAAGGVVAVGGKAAFARTGGRAGLQQRQAHSPRRPARAAQGPARSRSAHARRCCRPAPDMAKERRCARSSCWSAYSPPESDRLAQTSLELLGPNGGREQTLDPQPQHLFPPTASLNTHPQPPSIHTMSQRKTASPKAKALAEVEQKKSQLKQYADDDGHFSLVRSVLSPSLCLHHPGPPYLDRR